MKEIQINFDRGTLTTIIGNSDLNFPFPWIQWDKRSKSFRCHAFYYRLLIRFLVKSGFDYTDFTPKYSHLSLKLKSNHAPYPYQKAALQAWTPSKWGVSVLPTGSGKSFLAALAMEKVQRSTLILVPTIDLTLQWQENLKQLFQVPVGILGGGNFDIQDITVSTYESARIHAENFGNRFCFLIFDECHHLPSPANAEMARSYISPYRLALTATPVTEEDRIQLLTELSGPILYQQEIQELSGEYLAPYQIETITVELTEQEKLDYDYHRSIYLEFRDKVPRFGGKNLVWERFVYFASRSEEGRNALKSFHTQKQISVSAQGKFEELAKILMTHQKERILVFTNDNKTAYLISSLFLLPIITHETKSKERKEILNNFKSGKWPFLVNSRVLNEGVDVPEAGVAVIFSGTSTVREHVQRLGRILRKSKGKMATLYELITANTGEVFTSKKRREHGAYGN